MADLELLYFDPEDILSNATNSFPWSSNYEQITKKSLANENGYVSVNCNASFPNSGPWTTHLQDGQIRAISQHGTDAEITVNCGDDLETSFTCQEGDVSLQMEEETSPLQLARSNNGSHSSSSELHGSVPELSMMSDDELTSEASGKSADYGFIIAVTCLLTGILLVAISNTVPRGVKVNPDVVSAREMETLEWDNALVRAHLDRCVIAGLCLLTLGGVVLSTLLMVSMWKGEMFRRRVFAYSRQSAKLYGSINFRGGSTPPCVPSHMSIEDENLEEVLT
ncbi:transmembrane protein 74 [Esox lucius]|uniref:Transmembrane protein 74 n=1 Tax=Esox lucius TaxID=8010 RepID=A0AAY5KTX1_ESOLU|nr:transmembrane protein 74 [Esox lucius]